MRRLALALVVFIALQATPHAAPTPPTNFFAFVAGKSRFPTVGSFRGIRVDVPYRGWDRARTQQHRYL